MNKPVCAIVGVGEGNGAALARAFAAEGYSLALLARSKDFTESLAKEFGEAHAFACDAADPQSIASAFAAVDAELGQPTVLIYNAGSGARGDAETISLEAFETAWRVNALGALAGSQQVIPAMKERGGAIIFIGATASLRGGALTAAFAPAKAAQRTLAESMARSLWPQGIHVALIVIDAVVELPRTRAAMPDKPDDFFISPTDVASTAVWLVNQPRSAWTFEVVVRPFGEKW
ncbi:MAG TPA: SDR family NAD(P)-dependent oxidoreductase [Sphingomicrobium sp.]|jgi:NAD(P)-dependent dehydrogenase (short-subunit alcohol dehydrogenase family)|nr:SDR family NAD(P)-dependent oxidoreductase [Sphingomicrobium sp.]